MTNSETPQYLLADLRRRAGYTQQQVADRMGINRPRVAQIEQDFPCIRFDVAAAYAAAIGAPFGFLHADGSPVPVSAVAPDPRGPRNVGYRAKKLSSTERDSSAAPGDPMGARPADRPEQVTENTEATREFDGLSERMPGA